MDLPFEKVYDCNHIKVVEGHLEVKE